MGCLGDANSKVKNCCSEHVFICLGGNFQFKVKFITIEGLNAYSNYKIYRLGNFKIVIILRSKVSSVQFPERAQVVQSLPQHNHNFFFTCYSL